MVTENMLSWFALATLVSVVVVGWNLCFLILGNRPHHDNDVRILAGINLIEIIMLSGLIVVLYQGLR
jgi:hypothetical protein